MKIHTLDCCDCGKPIGYSFYQTEEQENVLCMDCIHRYLFVADLIGLGWIDINRVNNAEGLRYDKCLSVSLTWNKNVYSSVKEIEDGQISEDVETVSYDGEQKPARIG